MLNGVGGGRKLYGYHYSFNGFAAELTAAQAAKLSATAGVEHDDVLLYGSSLPEAVATLEAGTYFVRMEARADDAPLVGVAVSPVD